VADPGAWLNWIIDQVFDALGGSITKLRAGIDGEAVTVTKEIEATGYSREAEEQRRRSTVCQFAREQLGVSYRLGAEVDLDAVREGS